MGSCSRGRPCRRTGSAAPAVPAIDILASVSRLITQLVPREQYQGQSDVRNMMAKFREVQDMLMLGAYVRGSNQEYDRAIAMNPQIKEFCAQRIDEKVTYEDAVKTMMYLSGRG